MALAELFLAHAPPAPPARDGEAAGSSRPAPSEAALAELIARARRERPDCGRISDEALVIHAAARAAPADLPALKAGDLLLALACAARLPAALGAFESELLTARGLSVALARVDPSPAFLDEVRQVVREKLLLGKPGAPPKILDYAGRGSLGAWTQVVAMRCALDLRPARVEQDPSQLGELAGERDPELRILQERYGKAYEAALTQAFDALDDEQVNLLRLQIVDGLQTARIAALFQVDRSTIKRRLADCREALLAETWRILGDDLGASPDSLQSILRLVRSQLHVSVGRLLRDREGRPAKR